MIPQSVDGPVGSLVAAIGGIIERHMIETGFLAPAEPAGAKTVVQASDGVSATRLDPCIPKAATPGCCAKAGA
jgi:ribonucleoside-diphosphate reductase alpha chain